MTREEAIKYLQDIGMRFVPTDQYGDYDDPQPYDDAIDLAIKALSADAVQVVRCKDCKHRTLEGDFTRFYWCRLHDRSVDDTDHCSWGEERSEE